ncbi:large ribosomal subunit protein P2 isoform X2 [Aquarana catesbeiana]|uniref:large ribosomal subunit protein P2 isoform X2 n=1 Tax=Aquarana catesbeiana TaxID=8400 RepID=UPI003CC933A0
MTPSFPGNGDGVYSNELYVNVQPLERMRYIASYLLAVLGGNDNPTIADLKKILDSVGIELDKERADKIIGELKGKKIDEVIAQGNTKLASMPSGGAVAVASAGSAAPAASAAPGLGFEQCCCA